MQEIKINGKNYPCFPTIGGIVKYERTTGRKASEIGQQGTVTESVEYLYSLVWGACQREKVPFDFDLESFIAAVEVEELTKWAESLMAEVNGEQPQKKTKAKTK